MMNVINRQYPDERDLLLVDEASLRNAQELPVSPSDGGVWLLSEPRFYEVASHTSHDRCWGVKRWVMYEVLPTIRYLDPPSNIRVDLPMVQETERIAALLKGDGSDPTNPDDPIKPRARRKKRTTPYGLYRFFNAKGRLLYVGITWSVLVRVKGHRAVQPWWKQVCNMTVETYPSEEAARVAELVAIRTEYPMYNRQGVLPKPPTKLSTPA